MLERFHCDEPEWGPLESILPLEECEWFMYMGWLEFDGQRLHHYKHIHTRRYIFVTDELKTYRYLGGEHFAPRCRWTAIDHAIGESWWRAL